MPALPSNAIKREVVFGMREPVTELNVDSVIFSTSSVYTFVQEGDGFRTVVSNSDGSVFTYPSNSSTLEVDFFNIKQEKSDIITFTLPNYSYGSYYTYSFETDNDYISRIEVYVQMPDDEKYTQYRIEKVKYLIDPNDEVVFFNQTGSNQYTIEFGSGIHGNWVPSAQIKLIIYKSQGSDANFGQEIKATISNPVQLEVYNYFRDGSSESTTLEPNAYLRAYFEYSEGGIDPLRGERLRKSLVNFIQSRDNFLSERDFYNVVEKYTTDFRILFKKMLIQENVFYLQRALRDEFQMPLRSRNILPEIFKKNVEISGIHYYTQDIGILRRGLYYYTIRAFDNFHNELSSDEIKVYLDLNENLTGAIDLQWNKINGVHHYLVYGRTINYDQIWYLTSERFVDDGNFIKNIESIIESKGKLSVGKYIYQIRAITNDGSSILSSDVEVEVVLSENETEDKKNKSITLTWDPYPDVSYYLIYGRTADKSLTWQVDDESFIDVGDDTNVIYPDLEIGLPEVQEHPYVLFPKFNYDGQDFTSPFLYKFNEVYNYYEGFLFYPELIIHFSSILTTDRGKISGASLPSIFMNFIYDKVKRKTTISLKSYQKINEWSFDMTIPELNIYNVSLEPIDESTYSYDYWENSGFIINPVVITIRGNTHGVDVFEAKTAEISQRYDTTDLIQLPTFPFKGSNYIVDVPVIDTEKFESNHILYLDKVRRFLNQLSFSENRMISDNLEFRFLNTDSISSYLLVNSLLQGRNLYKGITFLDDRFNPVSIADSPDKIPLNGENWIIGSTEVPIVETLIDGKTVKLYQRSDYGGLSEYFPLDTDSPYMIVLNGDYTSKILPQDVIKIKKAFTPEINGQYHVVKVELVEHQTVIYVKESLNQSSNEGYLYFATYEQWRKGGPDNIAKWNLWNNAWEFTEIKPNDAITIREPIHETYVYNNDFEFVKYSLKLPLKMEIKIIVDPERVSRYEIDMEQQREEIILAVSQYLQRYYTSTDISYYPSAIISFIFSGERELWMKSVQVYTYDANGLEFKNGIETYSEALIRDKISNSKLEILKYTSAFFYLLSVNIRILQVDPIEN